MLTFKIRDFGHEPKTNLMERKKKLTKQNSQSNKCQGMKLKNNNNNNKKDPKSNK
jgi:hypothetical protein